MNTQYTALSKRCDAISQEPLGKKYSKRCDAILHVRSKTGNSHDRVMTDTINNQVGVFSPKAKRNPPPGSRSLISPEVLDLDQIVQDMLRVSGKKSTPDRVSRYKNLVREFYSVVLEEINLRLPLSIQAHTYYGHMRVSIRSIRNKFTARYTLKGTQYYWYDWFLAHPDYAPYTVINLGANVSRLDTMTGEHGILLSLIQPRYNWITMESIQRACAYKIQNLCIQETEHYDDVPICLASLDKFIQSLEEKLITGQVLDELRRDYRDLLQAQCIRHLAPEGVLRQYHARHKFSDLPEARTYYANVNLQSCSKRVRMAALGPCHQYDICASVYSFYLEILQRMRLPSVYISQYVQNRSEIRSQIARECIWAPLSDSHREELVKQALTALGFGAPLNAGHCDKTQGWQASAISQHIWNAQDLTRFINHPIIRGIYQEIKLVTQALRLNSKSLPAEVYDYAESDSPDQILLRGRRRRLNTNKLRAWRYQQWETEVMSYVTQGIESEVILRVHDAIYTKRPVALTQSRYATVRFEHTEYKNP